MVSLLAIGFGNLAFAVFVAIKWGAHLGTCTALISLVIFRALKLFIR